MRRKKPVNSIKDVLNRLRAHCARWSVSSQPFARCTTSTTARSLARGGRRARSGWARGGGGAAAGVGTPPTPHFCPAHQLVQAPMSIRRSDALKVKSSILTTSFSARIGEIRKGIGRFYPLLNEKIPGPGAPWTPLESLGALRAPRVGASRLLQLD